MLALLKETWIRLQPVLKEKAGEAAYGAWLEGLRPLALERGVLFVEAKSRLVCERVQRLFEPLLQETLSQELGTRVAVQIVPAPESTLPDRLEIGPSQPLVDASNRTMLLVLESLLGERALPATLFFFHGPAGTGKTFLLRWWAAHHGPSAKGPSSGRPSPRLMDAPAVTRAFQRAIRDRQPARLHAELTGAEPLIVDEVHRLAGQRRVQRELLAVIKARETAGNITLLASRWHPADIWDLDATLKSHFLSGFVAQLELPGPAARLRYLRAIEGAASRNGRAEDVEKLAREVRGSYVDLRRAWLLRRQGLGQRPRADYLELIEPRALFDRLQRRVTERLQVSKEDVVGPAQARRVSFARQVLAYLCAEEGLSCAEIGRFLGGRSRAAVSYCIKTLHKRMADEQAVRLQVEALL